MRDLLDQALVAYWPAWLFLGAVTGAFLLARADLRDLPELDERDCAAAGRPSPAPIDVAPAERRRHQSGCR